MRLTKKLLPIILSAGLLMIVGGASEAKAQEGCKNYLGRSNGRLCTEKTGYDACVNMLKTEPRRGIDLCVWTGDPKSRIERATRPEAAEKLTKAGCTVDSYKYFTCGEMAINICYGYQNFGVVLRCFLAPTKKPIMAKRADAFQLGVEMARVMYYAAITEAEWKKNKTMNHQLFQTAMDKRKKAIADASVLVKSINAAIPSKADQLDENKLYVFVDAMHEDNAATSAYLMKAFYGAKFTEKFKELSPPFYLGNDLGAADVIVQNDDTAKRADAVKFLGSALKTAYTLTIMSGPHSAAVDAVQSTMPLKNAYTKVYDLRQLYKEDMER